MGIFLKASHSGGRMVGWAACGTEMQARDCEWMMQSTVGSRYQVRNPPVIMGMLDMCSVLRCIQVEGARDQTRQASCHAE